VRLIADAASALEAAHDAGVLHRDIKPGNLLVTDAGNLKIVDFGLARIGEGRSLTLTGEIIGTPAYMGPEQLAAEDMSVDERTDCYALGVTLYEAISRRLPFEAPSVQSLIQRIIHLEPASPRKWNKKIPRDLETICLKAIEKDPARRYQSAREFANDLERFLGDEPIHARPAGPITRVVKFVRRRRTAAIASGIALVAIVIAAILFWQLMGKTLEERMDDARQLVSQGLTASVLGSSTEAIAAYTEALDVYKKSVEALVYRGTEYFVRGELEKAGEDFERGLRIKRDYPPLRVAYAAYLRGDGRHEEADKILEGLDISGITDPLQLDALATIHSVMGDSIQAIAMFRKARAEEPGRLSSLMGEGWSAFYLGRHEAAGELFASVHFLVPKKKLAALLLVYIRCHQARYATGAYRRRLLREASAFIDDLGSAVGTDAMATLSCASVDALHAPQGTARHDPVVCSKGAAALFERGKSTITEVTATLFYEILGLLLVDVNAELAGQYAEIAREHSSRGLAQYVLGTLAAHQGRTDEALKLFQNSLAHSPQNPEVLVALMQLRHVDDSATLVLPLARRVAHARQLIAVKPDAPQYSVLAGTILREVGQKGEARTAFDHARKRWEVLDAPEEAAKVAELMKKL